MDFSYDQKIKGLLLLVIALILLMIMNALFPGMMNYLKSENTKSFSSDISSLDSGIDNILENYGIKKEWQRKQVIPINTTFTRFERIIYIPINVPIVNINHEIVQLSEKFNTKISSSENIKNQVLLLHIKYKNDVVETIKFITDPELIRMKGKISLIISGFEKLSDMEQTIILQFPYFNTFLINVEDADSKSISKISKAKRDYFLSLKIKKKNDDEKYELANDLDSNKISKNIKQIFKDFEQAHGIIYELEERNGSRIEFIEDEMIRAKKLLINIKDLVLLEENDSGFKNIQAVSDKASEYDKAMSICRIRKENFDKLNENIRILQKKGFKFVNVEEYFKED